MKRKIILLIVFLAQMLIVTSCASTTLLNPWQDSSFQGPLKNVLVVGVVADPYRRSMIENEFVRQFKARGMEAVASRETLPNERVLNWEIIEPKVREHGADAVLVARFVKKETIDTYTPAFDSDMPMNFYENIEDPFQIPDLDEREMSYDYKMAVMRLTLYNAETKKPIWSSRTKTKYQGGGAEQIKPFVRFVVGKLAEFKLIN